MRKYTITIFVLLLLLSGTGIAQIYGPEGLNMPGAWNSWANPPATGSVFGGIQTTGGTVLIDNSLPTSRYRTRINVQASGGNVTPGTYEFLFTAGSAANPWGNKWANVTIIADSLQNYSYNTGANNSVTLTAGYYSVSWRNAGYSATNAIFMKTSAVPVTIDSVWGHPTTTAMSTPITVNVKLNALKSAEEKVYLRYSTDNFVTASFVEVTGFDGGTFTGTATIPGQSSAGVTVKFYALSTTVSSSRWGTQNADMLTLNFKKNAGDYFSYDVQPITSIAAGNWSSTATWNTGIVPAANASVTINTNVTLDVDATLTSLTINSGKTFTASDAGARTLTIAANGSIINNGTFVHGNGTVTFAGNGTVTGTVGFYNVNTAGGIDFGTASTVNAVFKLNAGGYVNTNSPIYTTGATLQYNAGGKYGRYLEWKDTTGAGYPYNVKISNGTILDISNGTANVERRIAGSLTIDSTCALTMDTLGSMTRALVVYGNIINNGRLILSSAFGGDLYLHGNLTNNGLLTPNTREINFAGTVSQSITTSAGSNTVIDFMAVSNPAGVTLGTLKNNTLTINNRLRFTSTGGLLTTGTDTLAMAASGYLQGETASRYVAGNLKVSKEIAGTADSLGNAGVSLSAGGNMGLVTVYRYTGSNGIASNGPATGIARKWRVTGTGTEPFSSRTATITWLSSDDNSKDIANAQAFFSSNGTTWSAISAFQNASSNRSVTATITQSGYLTVSDVNNSLGSNNYKISIANGNWNSAATWNNNTVPDSGKFVTINHNVVMNSNPYVAGITINSGKTLTVDYSTPRQLVVLNNGSFTNNGTFTDSLGSVSFAGNGTVNGTVSFYNVTVAGTMNFGTASTVRGSLQINPNATLSTNTVTYATGATLVYSPMSLYELGAEWSATSGPGYPYNVHVRYGTKLSIGGTTPALPKSIAGSLTIDSLCTVTADTNGVAMTAPLTVAGNVTNYGRLILSNQLGADMNVAGNFNNYGYFTTNLRELVFNGNGGQQWFNALTSTANYDYVNIADTSGVTVTGASADVLTINNRLRFTGTKGSLTINADTLVLGNSAVLEGEAADRYVIGNLRTSRAVGTSANTFGGIGVSLAAGTNIGTVTVTRYSGANGRVTVGGNSGIDRKWKISSSDSASFTYRTLTLAWVANDDNGKIITKAQTYTGSGSWTTLGALQNASSTRSVNVAVNSFSNYTVSDSANSLLLTSFNLTANVLIESLWNGSTTVQDTLTAVLHASSAPYAAIATAKAYANNVGICNFSITGISNETPYYIAIKHRNSIETWSAAPVSFSGFIANYNFTNAASQAYGNNLVLTGGKYCIYSGDVNQDGFVDFSDLTEIDNDSYNFSSGYLRTDLNGDLFVDFSDLTICDNNSYNFIGKVTPASSRVSGRSRVINRPAEAE